MYPIILKLHMALVVLSVLVFLGRAVLFYSGKSSLATRKSTVLLVKFIMLLVVISAGILCVMIGQYPFVDGWLTEKLVGLVLYIVLGVVSFKPGMNTGVRAILMVLTVAVFIGIAMIAKNHAGFIF